MRTITVLSGYVTKENTKPPGCTVYAIQNAYTIPLKAKNEREIIPAVINAIEVS